MPTIDPLSTIPLHLVTLFDNAPIGSATGFIVKREDSVYLITNWHVLSGRDPKTNKPISETGTVPDRIRIWQHRKGQLGFWVSEDFPLVDKDGRIYYIEADTVDGKVDVAALPIAANEEVDFYPLDISLAEADLVIAPSDPLSIIGFPYGNSAAGKLPIWKVGNVATDIDINYQQKPMFLIDATTKPGMSGSPVIARRSGVVHSSKGISLGGGSITKFMGIYSGRVQDEELIELSNLGQVWKPKVLNELLSKSQLSTDKNAL